MKTVFLIGFMGSGKTTLGLALAHATGMPLVDLDQYIEERTGMSVREYFACYGEEAFRREERQALEHVVAASVGNGMIVACGGGTPCRPVNMELMNSGGLTVWLQTSVPVLLRRLKEGRAQRPLIASLGDDELEKYIVDRLAERDPYYSAAAASFDSTFLESEEEVAGSVTKFITEFL